jgi:hypothetical protein
VYPFEQIANRGSSGLASGAAGLESALNPTELRLGFILSYNNNWANGRTIKRTIDGARDPRPTLIVVLDEPEPDMDFDSMDASNRRYFDSLDASKQRAS